MLSSKLTAMSSLPRYAVPIIGLKTSIIPDWFKTFMNFLLYVNSWSNVFAYYSTNSTFRDFTYCVFSCSKFNARRASGDGISTAVIENLSNSLELIRPRSSSVAPSSTSGGGAKVLVVPKVMSERILTQSRNMMGEQPPSCNLIMTNNNADRNGGGSSVVNEMPD